MKKLMKRFKKLSPINKAKLIIFFPLLIISEVADTLIDIGAFVCKFVIEWYRQILVILTILVVTIIVLPIFVHSEQEVPTFKGKSKYDAQMYVYKYCHQMANNFIVADDEKVRGFVKANEENIEKLLSVLKEYDVKDKDKIIQCLNEFRNDDYHSAVWLHNYCWTKLDGEVGYAVGLKNKYR